jgi:hypothetical protein
VHVSAEKTEKEKKAERDVSVREIMYVVIEDRSNVNSCAVLLQCLT